MTATIYAQALFVIADGAYIRGAGVTPAFFRTFLNRRRFVRFRMGGRIPCASPYASAN